MAQDDVRPKKLIVHVPEDDIEDLKHRLSRTRFRLDPHLVFQISHRALVQHRVEIQQLMLCCRACISDLQIPYCSRILDDDKAQHPPQKDTLYCIPERGQTLPCQCRWPDELEGVGWEYGAKKSYMQVCPLS